MSKLTLQVVAAASRVLSREVDSVRLPGISGEFGILPGHAPMICVLDIGVLRYTVNGKMTKVALGGGFLEVKDNLVTVLVETAETREAIDVTRARRAAEHARGSLKGGYSSREAAEAEAALRRALARLQAAQ